MLCVAPALAERFTTIVPDLRGYGLSSVPASHKGEKVAIKGILLGTTEAHRINVTSLQGLGIRCE